jgi:hypothetical protein
MNPRLKSFLLALTLLTLSSLIIAFVSPRKADANRQRVPLITLQSAERVLDAAPFVSAIASAPSASAKQLYVLSRDTGNILIRDVENRRNQNISTPESALRAIAVGSRGQMYLAGDSQIRVIDDTGRSLNTFSVPSPSSIAALGDGRVLVASPNSEQLLNVYNAEGLLLGRLGQVKHFDADNDVQNSFLNRGKVAVSPTGEIYYVSMFAATPTVQKFSSQGKLLSEFAIEGEAVDLQLRHAREFLSAKSAETVGGFYVITAAAIDPGTGHLWVGMNGSSRYGEVSPESGVVYEYSSDGVKLAEYAFRLNAVQSEMSVITDVRDIAVNAPWIYVLTAGGQVYRFNLSEGMARKEGGRETARGLFNEQGLAGYLKQAFWTPPSEPVPPPRPQASCPPEQPFTCVANCPQGSSPMTRDCAAEIRSRLSQGDHIINDSCTISQATPGGCSGNATSCNTGTGVQVSYSVSLNCNAAPTPTPPQTASCHPSPLLLGWCYNGGSDWIWPPDGCGCDGPIDKSPILIDVAGDGFAMTDAAGGVYFNLDGVAKAERLSWTAPNSDDAFLVLDRNSNGLIDNGEELFGNLTPPQPFTTSANGFLALAEYNKMENGGNGDGLIDSRDLIFSSLRLWQDINHNGISEPNELHSLPELGVASISFDYKESRRVDLYGNRFRYRATVKLMRQSRADRWAWDVFLVEGR